jgi:hypothetical protein
MIELKLRIDLAHSNPDYESSGPEKDILLTLATVPPITYDPGKGKRDLGLWMCSSLLFGQNFFGTYDIVYKRGLDMSDPATTRARERRNRDGWARDDRLVNPVGRFFDSTSGPDSDGFADFYGFSPTAGQGAPGFGMFSRWQEINIKMSGFSWSRSR